MLKEVNWARVREYESGTENEPLQFYIDALCNSNSFDLLLGYFSSSAIHILSAAFANFLYRGGKMRLIINNFLSKEDRDSVEKGLRNEVPANLLRIDNIDELKSGLDEYGEHFFNCLSWLISQNKIEIKIIKPKGKKGISHYKSGVFSDGINEVGYRSSCNFTAFGLVENLEQLTCNLSWEDDISKEKINNLKSYFNDIFLGEAEFVEYLKTSDIEEAIKNNFGNKDLDQLIINENDLLEKRKRITRNEKIKNSLKKAIKDLELFEEEKNKPKFPFKNGPREYQKEATRAWYDNNCKGVFAMATGTGKTLTALNCLLEEYRRNNNYQAVIVVPTISLVDQWKQECSKFNFNNVIVVNSKEKWEDSISFINTANRFFDTSFIVIVTYASFYRKKFFSYLKRLSRDVLFIADEAHNLGSSKVSKKLNEIPFSKRIGLSATPNRKYDSLGNIAISKFFEDSPPYCYNFPMDKAIDKGFLCKYAYYPKLVSLNDQELDEYIKISKRLIPFFDTKHGKYKDSPDVEKLLLQRKRIIHKAANKLPAFEQILKYEFRKRNDLKYTLVYVPEGVEPNYDKLDTVQEDEEELRLINTYSRAVSSVDSSIMVKQFTGGTKDRKDVLDKFEKGDIHVLTSMKCLDEGVDIPRSELAIFCSSTGNPRQFIQRRGRILRNHSDKTYATIYDLVVFPGINEGSSTYNMEKSLFKSELDRVKDFSEMSLNSMDTYDSLKPALDFFNISLYN